MESNGFSKVHRLCSAKEIQRLRHQGRVLCVGPWRLRYIENYSNYTRLLLAISAKTCCAVHRNKIKRLLRESFRLNQPIKSAGLDVALYCNVYSKFKIEQVDQLWKKLLKDANNKKSIK